MDTPHFERHDATYDRTCPAGHHFPTYYPGAEEHCPMCGVVCPAPTIESEIARLSAAFEELRRRTEGAAALSFSEALEYLDSDDAADLIEAAGLADLSTRTIFERLTGFRL